MIGISLPTRGRSIVLPICFLYLLSFGLTATAESPSMVSGLVVATTKYSSSPLIGYLKYHKCPFISLCTTSSSLIADLETGHQFTNLCPL